MWEIFEVVKYVPQERISEGFVIHSPGGAVKSFVVVRFLFW